MRLTAFTDFGLRALMRLAGEPERSFDRRDCDRVQNFPASPHQVVRDLAAGGFITTQRGAGGGFRQSRPAETITLGEVVRTLEQRHALVECFRGDGGACVLTPHCRLKPKLARAREAFMRELDATTLAECAYRGTPSFA